MRRQFLLDAETDRLLDKLAACRAGNRSFVVREAVRVYAAMERTLEEVEADPRFQRMMERSARDIRQGRVYSHDKVRKQLAKANRNK
jgi:predicted transcriptional regulator